MIYASKPETFLGQVLMTNATSKPLPCVGRGKTGIVDEMIAIVVETTAIVIDAIRSQRI